ncbi:MAG: glycoside hydrolase family 99-like domain-containing protein [Treponema sp.]|nr:glycoside hydrolase family 99-like domain-containing protein [Treponema sp.]
MNKVLPRIIAFYLPQFHPIPENDEWWGKGFTEWTNVGKAKKMFPGHYQPRVPADLGYYDLRVAETREAQAKLARDAGIEGFCYWHYWFGDGKQLLERPFNEVLVSGKPDFPFCLAWANESWYAKLWDKDVKKDKLLIEQKYGDVDDYRKHFYSVLPAFKDKRYMTQDDKPIFMIYKPLANPEITNFMKLWNELALKEGLKGIYWVGHCIDDVANLYKYKEMGFDSINVYCKNTYGKTINPLYRGIKKVFRTIFSLPYITDYNCVIDCIADETEKESEVSPTIFTGWDHTPRSGKNGCVMLNYTPKNFARHVCKVLDSLKYKKNGIIFLKSWNEWAEGNYIEPDLKYGHDFLNSLKNSLYEYISGKEKRSF